MNKRKGDRIAIRGDYQYNAYYTGNAVQRFWHYAKLQEALRQLTPQQSDRILDAGCGSGLLSHFLAKDSNAQVWGADANPDAIAFCNSRFHGPNLQFVQALIDELPFEDRFFNKIAFLEVIEHLTPAQGLDVLKSFNKLLTPGGTLVISTPNKKSLWPVIEFTLDSLHLVPTLDGDQHEFLYSGPRLISLAQKAGFDCISRTTINFLSPWLAPVSWKLAAKLYALELKYHLQEVRYRPRSRLNQIRMRDPAVSNP
jgi:2-polyprenyl-3-methyl-5-hydroxy-6-metoxy-1,4-benzoquinol methylase